MWATTSNGNMWWDLYELGTTVAAQRWLLECLGAVEHFYECME